jgi:hypothetical protein
MMHAPPDAYLPSAARSDPENVEPNALMILAVFGLPTTKPTPATITIVAKIAINCDQTMIFILAWF